MTNKTDEYLTISEISEGFYKEKGSKFLAFVIPCKTEDKAKEYIDKFRKEHHNACHVCFAWRFGTEKFHDRYSDDGEPNNSAGKPIFGQIIAFDLTNVLIAVVRYYGGTNLGVGGLVNAYKTSAKEALKIAKIRKRSISNYYEITYNYSETGAVMSLLNKFDASIKSQNFDDSLPSITVFLPRMKSEGMVAAFELLININIKLIYTR